MDNKDSKKELAVSLSGQIWMGEVDDITINSTGEAGVIKEGAVEVTQEAVNAVFSHMARREDFVQNGFTGYEFKDKDGNPYFLLAIDPNKYEVVRKK